MTDLRPVQLLANVIKAALVVALGLLILDIPFFVASLALGIFALMLVLSMPV